MTSPAQHLFFQNTKSTINMQELRTVLEIAGRLKGVDRRVAKKELDFRKHWQNELKQGKSKLKTNLQTVLQHKI